MKLCTKKNISLTCFNLLGVASKAKISKLNERLPLILKEIKASSHDIICLQEVSYDIFLLLESFAFSNNYQISPKKELWKDLGKHFIITVMLSKKKLINSYFFCLPPQLNHKNYTMNLCFLKEIKIWCANIHLFSGSSQKNIRNHQLDFIIKILQEKITRPSTLVLCGDFNTDFDTKENLPILEKLEKKLGLKDLWLNLHPQKKGPTQDPQKNPLRLIINPQASKKRVDAIFATLSPQLKANKIEITMNHPIYFNTSTTSQQPFCLSDHFALDVFLSLTDPPY